MKNSHHFFNLSLNDNKSVQATPVSYALPVFYCNERIKIPFYLRLSFPPPLSTLTQIKRAARLLKAGIEKFGKSENLPEELLNELEDIEIDDLLYIVANGFGDQERDFFIDIEALDMKPIVIVERQEGEIFRLLGIGIHSVYLESIENLESVIVDYEFLGEAYDPAIFSADHTPHFIPPYHHDQGVTL